MLWVSSMPCNLPADETIPIGRYGSSNVGRAKSVYRMGLAHRYGRRMQTISGIHYNWSLPERVQRAVLRADPQLPPPCVPAAVPVRRFAGRLLELRRPGASTNCSTLTPGTMYMPHGTSLRMGRLGYQSEAQASLAVSYNGLDGYAASLQEALTRPYPAYEAVGIMNPGGEYNQLATSLLQIENEFYGTIRPKRVIRPGERPLHALRERGVEYVEVRLLDLNPFVPVGITAQTIRFLDVFLLHCLLSDSPPDTPQEIAALGRNQHRTAAFGREPGLVLERGQRRGQAGRLGRGDCSQAFAPDRRRARRGARRPPTTATPCASAQALLQDPDLLPSARVLAVDGAGFRELFHRLHAVRSRNRPRPSCSACRSAAAQQRPVRRR